MRSDVGVDQEGQTQLNNWSASRRPRFPSASMDPTPRSTLPGAGAAVDRRAEVGGGLQQPFGSSSFA